MAKTRTTKIVETLKHDEATRKNIPTAEYQSVMQKNEQNLVRVAYERRNRDLDPQLVWRGKDEQDWSDLVVHALPLYIQEKVHPKVLIDDLLKQTRERRAQEVGAQIDLFSDFNGIAQGVDKTEFYRHEQNWSNCMILGDSLQVMTSLAEREGLRGKVQCIYLDPPYGIKFNSNFQWSTTSRDVKDGKADHITREPEQVKAFRDTWRDGIHSYLAYLRDRLTVARDLLTGSGSIFVQIGDENVHRVRAVMDEVFGEDNFVAQISTKTSGGSPGVYLAGVTDYVLWFARDHKKAKYRALFGSKELGEDGAERSREVELPDGARVYRQDNLTSQSVGRDKGEGAASWFPVRVAGQEVRPSIKVRWKTNEAGMDRLLRADRVELTGNSLAYVCYLDDFIVTTISNAWVDIGGIQSRADTKVYVVQTPTTLIQRCLLMTTDPGDLVLDPTCGSGTTAYVAEQWGRRWITIDTSRVALALARATEFNKLGRIPVLKARMNADLHMAADLKNTGKGNLFVIFGEPDITILPAEDGKIRVKVNGVDVFHPQTGEVRGDGPDGIACWFIDTDYNEESFFVRHAYFLGANDPYSALKTTLKAEINEEAWATLNSDTSRAFAKPNSGRIAVKVINHFGDEVMKVFKA